MISVDITDISRHDWIYKIDRKGRHYRQNLLALKLREAGIPATGVKAWQGVWKGDFKIEHTDDDRCIVIWWEDK